MAPPTESWIGEMQSRLRPRPVVPRLRRDYRAIARWWELEAMRGYDWDPSGSGLTSSEWSRLYAANYRWLVELMDTGHRVTSDAHGVYVDGELASAYMARARKRAEHPTRPRKTRSRS